MRIKDGFKKRELAGEFIVMADGLKQVNFNKMMVLNGSASYLWDNVVGKDFNCKQMAELLVARYDVDIDTAAADAKKLADQWIEAGIIEDEQD